MTTTSSQPWWKESMVYQIYPSSFLAVNPQCPPNSRENVVGNIQGVISKIPYIASLGFDAVWLSPIYASPQKDMGYDISNYRDIHSPFGNVDDVQQLIDTLHATTVSDGRGGQKKMRLLMDLVVNHTSDEHPWFVESASSHSNPKSDWYHWRDPKVLPDGTTAEPNNWRSIFGGPAWHYVEARKQYYLALFLPGQPDLNWEKREMREQTYDDMRWWLTRGIDGFRIDSMNLMSKVEGLPDAAISQPLEKYQNASAHYASGPKMHDYLQEIRREVFDKYDDIFTVGEMGSSDTEEGTAKYVAKDRHELNTVFLGMDHDFGPTGKYDGSDPFTVSRLRDYTERWQLAMPKFDAWNTIYTDNHDRGRGLSRYADDSPQHRANAAKMLATYYCTLSGTPFILSGQEIAMANLPKTLGIESYIDVEGQNWYQKVLAERKAAAAASSASETETETETETEIDMSDVMTQLQLKARDHGRLPMQWDGDAAHAGFCSPEYTPWMTINPDYKEWNVKSQIDKKGSVLEYWKRVIALRKEYADVLVYGSFKMLASQETTEEVMVYERASREEKDKMVVRLVVLLSFGKEGVVMPCAGKYKGWKVLLGNMRETGTTLGQDGVGELKAFESLILIQEQAC